MDKGRSSSGQRTADSGRILVTGGAGFIGANFVRMLLAHGYQVTVLDNLSTGRREYLDGLPIQFIQGDILDTDLVNRVVPGHDGIVHLAAQTGVPGSLANPRRDCEINIFGTLNLLEACRCARSDCCSPTVDCGEPRTADDRWKTADSRIRFIFASSNAPLGRQPPPATEEKVPLPISPYGASKLAGEAYCLAYYGSWRLETVVLRFGNVYGPFSAHKNSVVAKFSKDMLAKGQITIDGEGNQTRDFVYVDDLCWAILLALESDVAGEVFQIATGVGTSIQELAMLVQDVVGRNVSVQYGLPRKGDVQMSYSAISKAQEMLGWEPKVDLIDGLRRTWTWFED